MKILYSILHPYFSRLKIGEGGLVIFCLLHSVFAHPSEISLIIYEMTIAFFIICALYGLNDYIDRKSDLQNVKKEKQFVYFINQNESLFLATNVSLSLVSLAAAFSLLGLLKFKLLLLLYGVNFLYSAKFKSIPVIDILIVIIWGGLYTMIAGSFNFNLFLTAGIMTGIAHLFQMITDEPSDKLNGIRTSIVELSKWKILILILLCIFLGYFLFLMLNVFWGITCLLPAGTYMLTNNVVFSWHVSRVYFLVCWLPVLAKYYGGI